jgi:glycosyltransferase involved in cell wall biosynthesis
MKKYFFSIIIPVKRINSYVYETVKHIQNQNYNNWEVIIVENTLSKKINFKNRKIKVISSGTVGPGDKRDLASKLAMGEILTFLDDDSFPSKNYLNTANFFFNKYKKIVGLGGPSITPNSNSLLQKVSGSVFLSKYSGGFPERYVSYKKIKSINDWPSVNLMIKKKHFFQVEGFNCKFWPGEDTDLCYKITKKLNLKLLYIPNLIVFHHRRESLISHIKQISAYGLHRGFFFKTKPETSRKIKFLFPSLFFIFCLVSGITLIFNFESYLTLPFILLWIVYLLMLIKCFYDIQFYNNNLLISFLSLPLIFITHFFYGMYFIKGSLSKNLISKLR